MERTMPTKPTPKTQAMAGKMAKPAPKTPAGKAAKPAAKPQSRTTGQGRASAPKTPPREMHPSKQAGKAKKSPRTRPAAARPPPSKHETEDPAVRKMRSEIEIIDAVAQRTNQPRTVVRGVLDTVGREVRRHLKPRGSGRVSIPGLGISLRRVNKPATAERQGYNPMAGKPITIGARPARIVVRAKVLKKLRDTIGAAKS
jgi:nucleoid DNA-binding protein